MRGRGVDSDTLGTKVVESQGVTTAALRWAQSSPSRCNSGRPRRRMR